MIASRFRTVAWAAGVAAAALGCYLVSLQVASERGQLMTMERRILAARADIRQLRTEIDTRARLVQLERWNRDVLGLQAPQVTQYAAGAVELAGYIAPRTPAVAVPAVVSAPSAVAAMTQVALRPAAPAAPGRAAPAAPAHAAPQPAVVRQATYIRPAGIQPLLHKAALVLPEPAPAAAPPDRASRTPLLGDSLLGDIGRAAAIEAAKQGR